MNFRLKLVYLTLILIFIVACKDSPVVTPKKRIYPKVEFPLKSYRLWDSSFCPLKMEIPKYSHIERKERFFTDDVSSDCWFDLLVPKLNGTVHCSYYPLSGFENYEELREDAFQLVDKHNIRASSIENVEINKADGTKGFLFKIEGPVASSYQFYLSDSEKHFFRGSLYFNSKINVDSMRIVVDFLAQDLEHMIETFEWK